MKHEWKNRIAYSGKPNRKEITRKTKTWGVDNIKKNLREKR
jgi:hypothetical protein